MRRSREDTAETRRRIVETASRLFRARGITPVSVGDIMGALGLTVGGFYRHFESKEALVSEAIDAASDEASSRHAKATADADLASALRDGYLSKAHRDHPELGCPVAALCSEVAHESLPTREAFTRAMNRLLETVGGLVQEDTKEARDRHLFTAALMVGAVVLSRATPDERLSDDLLRVARDGVLREAPRERSKARPAERSSRK